MKGFWNLIQSAFAVLDVCIGCFLGNKDRLVYVLIVFVVIDFLAGVMCAVVDKKLSSSAGFRGLCRKILIFLLVGIANILDVYVIGRGSALRTAVILFYISNEGVSLLEKVSYLGLPVPAQMMAVLRQLHNRGGDGKTK